MTEILIDQPGIFEATEDEYHADPLPEASLSSTLMKELLARTPLHAWTKSPRLNPYFEPTNKTQFDLGHAVHTVFLGTGASIHVIAAPAFTTKAAREERDLCYERGLTPLLTDQWEKVKDMLEAGRQQLRANECGDVFDGGECEVNFAAQIGGVWNRARIDCIDRENRVLYDLKTTGESADPDAFIRAICNFGYPCAHAMGSVTFNVVSLHSPPRYPRRVFFTRRFTDPDGAVLKLSGLICKTLNTFRENVEGIGFDFELEADMDPVSG